MLYARKAWVLDVADAVATNDTLVWANVFRSSAGLVTPVTWQGYGQHNVGQCSAPPPAADTNRHGGDLYNVQLPPGDGASSCARDCCEEPRCQAYVFQASGYGVNGVCNDTRGPCCWLKAAVTSAAPARGVTAGVVQAAPLVPATAARVTWPAALVASGGAHTATAHYPGGASIPLALTAGSGNRTTFADVPLRRGTVVIVVAS